MLTVRGQPIEVLGAVVDGMEPPEQGNPMLKAVAPANEKVAQNHDFHRLQPPGLGRHKLPNFEPGARVALVEAVTSSGWSKGALLVPPE
jgi:hypothetical protein